MLTAVYKYFDAKLAQLDIIPSREILVKPDPKEIKDHQVNRFVL